VADDGAFGHQRDGRLLVGRPGGSAWGTTGAQLKQGAEAGWVRRGEPLLVAARASLRGIDAKAHRRNAEVRCP